LPLWQRKEVQKMLRSLSFKRAQRSVAAGFLARFKDTAAPCALSLLVIASLPLRASILPDQIGAFARGATKPLAADDASLYREFGFISAEQAQYTATPDKTPGGSEIPRAPWRYSKPAGRITLHLQSCLPSRQKPPTGRCARTETTFFSFLAMSRNKRTWNCFLPSSLNWTMPPSPHWPAIFLRTA
jgi:hypothetical protein